MSQVNARRPSLLGRTRPPVVEMLLAETPHELLRRMARGVAEGTDGFGVQIECLRREFRTEATMRELVECAEGRPIYMTNYRKYFSGGMTEEERMDELDLAARCGVSLVDLTGDTFAPGEMEITHDEAAVRRQKDTIARFHDSGAEVMMSSHVLKFLPVRELVKLAVEHQKRGVDISKIVTWSGSMAELEENLLAVETLKRELDIPFLFLSSGEFCRIHRVIGPRLGVAMYLATDGEGPLAYKEQPRLFELVNQTQLETENRKEKHT